MKDFDVILSRVLERAPTCPEPTAIRYIRDAAIEFCRRTRIWRKQDTFELTGDNCEGLTIYEGTQIYEITSATWFAPPDEAEDDETDRGIKLKPVTMDWLDKYEHGWREKEGQPVYLIQTAPNTVRLVPTPENQDDNYGRLRLELILLPSQSATKIPAVLVDTYQDDLAHGALANILALPAEFGNADLAGFHTAKFAEALGRWSDRVPRGQQRAIRRTRHSGYF